MTGTTPIAPPHHAASPSKDFLSAFLFLLERAIFSAPFWWAVCLGCAGILALSARHSMNPDGLSYLDMASEGLRSGPSGWVNGYWSPGYPALLSLALALFHPSPAQEFPLVHFVNFLIFVMTLSAFHFFLRSWLLSHTNSPEATGDREKRELVPFAFCTFLWFTLDYIGVAVVTPDLLVAAIIFLAAGITCRLSLPRSSTKRYLALGLTLGLGYYIKAVMFPLSLFFLGGLLLYPSQNRVLRRRAQLLLSLAVFILIAAPLVMALSSRVGRPSFGETGRLNYIAYVNGLQQYARWATRTLQVYGVPQHPPRILMRKPLVFEFDSPFKGTSPFNYDPSYWWAGANAGFDLREQVAATRETLRAYKAMFFEMAAFVAGAMVLYILTAPETEFKSLLLRESWLITWPITAVLMYALVHVESRFLGAFVVLFWLAIYRALSFRLSRRLAVAVCATVIGTVMIPFIVETTEASASAMSELVHSKQPDYEMVAVTLQDLGLRSGDRLAVVEEAFDPYYARYARLRVVAEIPDKDEFWNLSGQDLQAVAESLTQAGVKAIVAKNRPPNATVANWRDVKVSDSERFSILLLSEPVAGNPLR